MRASALLRTGVAIGVAALLTSCGGELLAVVGFIGSAGGDWLQDDQPNEQGATVGLQLRSNCRPSGGSPDCRINIQPAGGAAQSMFSTDFDVTYTSNLPNCPDNGTGRASGKRLVLNGCFTGEYVTINQAVSDSGTVRMFFNFTPSLAQGVWVEIQDGQRRFGFNDEVSGCEMTTAPTRPVQIALSRSRVADPTGPFETTIASFTVQGEVGAWQGRFVGVSGMRLTRGAEVLELERRTGVETCP